MKRGSRGKSSKADLSGFRGTPGISDENGVDLGPEQPRVEGHPGLPAVKTVETLLTDLQCK